MATTSTPIFPAELDERHRVADKELSAAIRNSDSKVDTRTYWTRVAQAHDALAHLYDEALMLPAVPGRSLLAGALIEAAAYHTNEARDAGRNAERNGGGGS